MKIAYLSVVVCSYILAITPSVLHAATGSFGLPFTSSIDQTRITQPYGCFDCTDIIPNKFHSGIDMRPCDAGDTTNCISSDKRVLAVEEGTVCKIIENGKNDGGFGNSVIIKHPNGLFTFYAHLADVPKNSNGDELKVYKKKGPADQTGIISKNQQIGIMGGTGSGKPDLYDEHLHFGVLETCKTGKGYYPEYPGIHKIRDPWRYFESTAKAESEPITVIRDPILGVRTGPNIRSNFMDANDVGMGQSFSAYAETNDWFNIYLPCGQKSGSSGSEKACSGWVKKLDDSCRSSDKKCAVIEKSKDRVRLTSTDVVPVRTSPGTIYPKILGQSANTTYPLRIWRDQEFPVKSGPSTGTDRKNNKCNSDKWYEIDITQDTGHLSGWICGDHLTFIKGESSSGFFDDFNDNDIDPLRWPNIGGNDVSEQDQILKVETNVTDSGGYIASQWINIDPNKPLTITRRVQHHYGNDKYKGIIRIELEGDPDYSFGVTYGNMNYQSGIYCSVLGFYLFRNNQPGGQCVHQPYLSDRINPIWDQWFDERIVYDPRTGDFEYHVNNQLQTTFNVGALPSSTTNRIRIFINAWGWFTGHYHYVDDLVITQ